MFRVIPWIILWPLTADLGAGDCLLDCGPVLLNFSSLHNQIYGV